MSRMEPGLAKSQAVSWEAEQTRKLRRDRQVRIAVVAIAYALLILWGIVSLFPIFYMISGAFMELATFMTVKDLKIIPEHPTMVNFRNLLDLDAPEWIDRRPFGRWLFNSTLVAIIPTLSNLIFDSAAGYALARMRFPGSKQIFWAIIATMTIPGFVTLIPLYRLMFDFQWINTYYSLVVVHLAGVGGIFLFKQAIQTLPMSILDAARMDACGEWWIFWKIVIPLSKPILVVMGVFGFMGGWNDFFWPMLMAQSTEMYTIQAGITAMSFRLVVGSASGAGLDYGVLMAGTTLAAIPMVIVFFAFQKFIMKGVTIGALKG